SRRRKPAANAAVQKCCSRRAHGECLTARTKEHGQNEACVGRGRQRQILQPDDSGSSSTTGWTLWSQAADIRGSIEAVEMAGVWPRPGRGLFEFADCPRTIRDRGLAA